MMIALKTMCYSSGVGMGGLQGLAHPFKDTHYTGLCSPHVRKHIVRQQ